MRGIASIRADGDGVGAKGFGDVVDVVEEGTDVAAAAEECGYIGDAHGAPGVEYCADDVVGFASDVFIDCAGDGVADDDGLCGCFCCVEAGLPAGVGEVNDDSEAVHFVATVACPKSLKPASLGSPQPSPMGLRRLYVRCIMRAPSCAKTRM